MSLAPPWIATVQPTRTSQRLLGQRLVPHLVWDAVLRAAPIGHLCRLVQSGWVECTHQIGPSCTDFIAIEIDAYGAATGPLAVVAELPGAADGMVVDACGNAY